MSTARRGPFKLWPACVGKRSSFAHSDDALLAPVDRRENRVAAQSNGFLHIPTDRMASVWLVAGLFMQTFKSGRDFSSTWFTVFANRNRTCQQKCESRVWQSVHSYSHLHALLQVCSSKCGRVLMSENDVFRHRTHSHAKSFGQGNMWLRGEDVKQRGGQNAYTTTTRRLFWRFRVFCNLKKGKIKLMSEIVFGIIIWSVGVVCGWPVDGRKGSKEEQITRLDMRNWFHRQISRKLVSFGLICWFNLLV